MNIHDATEQAYKNGYEQGVREMQERINAVFRGKYAYTRGYIYELVDQIAKELLEG